MHQKCFDTPTFYTTGNIKSMEDEVGGNWWVGCGISLRTLFAVLRDSNCVPLISFLSPAHLTEDLLLNIVIINYGK